MRNSTAVDAHSVATPPRGELLSKSLCQQFTSKALFLTLLIAILFTSFAHAAMIDRPLKDSVQEQTARAIFRELRCVVCDGQSLAESDAVLALQMREHVRSMVVEGKSRDEILAYFRERYGEHILLTPPLEPYTALLWLGPLLMLAVGGVLVWRVTRPKERANV